MAKVRAVRRKLGVAGAWGYERRGDVVYVVLDESIPECDVPRYIGLVELLLGIEFSSDG